MSLLSKYSRPSIHFGTINQHEQLIYNYLKSEVNFETPACYSQKNEVEYDSIEVMTMDSEEAENMIASRVKLTIEEIYRTCNIYIDVFISLDQYDLLSWIMSFQTKFNKMWIIDRKETFEVEYSIDNEKLESWIADYYEMVSKSIMINTYQNRLFLETEYNSAKYRNFMKWLDYGRKEYGINVKLIDQPKLIHFKASLERVYYAKMNLNDLLIEYGYTWLKPSGVKCQRRFKYELTKDPLIVQITDTENGETVLWKWKTNEWNIYGAWFNNIRARNEINRKIHEHGLTESITRIKLMYNNWY